MTVTSAHSFVATAPSPALTGLSLTVATVAGDFDEDGNLTRFPDAPFNATVWPTGELADLEASPNAEIIQVTAKTLNTGEFTIVRAQESSAARAILVGDQVAIAAADAAVSTARTAIASRRTAHRHIGATTATTLAYANTEEET